MTQEQYDRWKDFAIRMARTAFVGRKRPSEAWIIERVEDIFADLDNDPERVAVIHDWDNNDPDGLEKSGYHCIGDWMTERSEDDNDRPGYWWIRRLKDGQRPQRRHNESWDSYWKRRNAHEQRHADKLDMWEEREEERGQDRESMAYDRFENDWYGPVKCCVRAGLDIASSPSAGVVGFNIGTIRTMYPEGIPEWIRNYFTNEDGSRIDLDAEDPAAQVWL